MVMEYGSIGVLPIAYETTPDEPLIAPDTSLGWIARLERLLDARAPEARRFADYYDGQHPLFFATAKYRELFGQLFRGFADNFCGVVVDAVEERLDVQGFRFGTSATIDAADEADRDAWRIWQVNQLDAWSGNAHTEALVKGEAYALVSPFRNEWPDSRTPLITIEDALECVVETSPANRRVRLAALKRFRGDDDRLRATLYLPDRIEKYIERSSDRPVTNASQMTGLVTAPTPVQWEPLITHGEPWPLENMLGMVPVVPLVNRPRLSGFGRSEIAPVTPIQDALNKLFTDMLVASEYGAFRQRWATGIEIPTDPQTGQPTEPYKTAIDRFISTAAPDARFGEFEQTDLATYVKAIETAVQHIATITRTPPHYLLGQSGTFPSGESLKATETGLVAKARRKMRHFGESWEDIIRLSFLALEDSRGKIMDSETIWADPESQAEAEHVDALVKMGSLRVPDEALWERWGATPQEVARWKAINASEPVPPAPVNPLGTKPLEVAN